MKRSIAFTAACGAVIVCTTSRPVHAREPLKEGPTVSAEEALGPPAPAPPPFAYNRQTIIGDTSGYDAKQAAANAQELLGQRLVKQGNLNGAVEAFRAAVDLRPRPEAYEMLIDALLLARRDAEALATFREYVYPKPGRKINSSGNQNADTLLRFALLLAKAGQYDEVITVYQAGEAKVANVFGPRVDVAFFPKAFNRAAFEAAVHTCLGLEGRYFRDDPKGVKANAFALAEYRRAIAAKPDFALAHFYLGETLRVVHGGLSDEARAAYEKAAKLGRGAVVERVQKALNRP